MEHEFLMQIIKNIERSANTFETNTHECKNRHLRTAEYLFDEARADRRIVETYEEQVNLQAKRIENEYYDFLVETVDEMKHIMSREQDPARQKRGIEELIYGMGNYVQKAAFNWENKYMPEEYLIKLRRLSEYNPDYEYLAHSLKNKNITFMVEMNEDLARDVKQLQNNMLIEYEEYSRYNNVAPENLEKSERPNFSEVMGINHDSRSDTYWMEVDGKITPLKFGPGEKKMYLTDGRAIAMKDETGLTEFYTYDHDNPIEMMRIDKVNNTYLYVNNEKGIGFSINGVSGEMLLKNSDNSMEKINLKEITPEEKADLVSRLTEMCPNSNDYFYRALKVQQVLMGAM